MLEFSCVPFLSTCENLSLNYCDGKGGVKELWCLWAERTRCCKNSGVETSRTLELVPVFSRTSRGSHTFRRTNCKLSQIENCNRGFNILSFIPNGSFQKASRKGLFHYSNPLNLRNGSFYTLQEMRLCVVINRKYCSSLFAAWLVHTPADVPASLSSWCASIFNLCLNSTEDR